MKLECANHADRLTLCRQYYYIGMFFLPFIWLTNFIWFYKYAFADENFEQKKDMQFYVLASLAGTLAWLCPIVTWITVFQLNSVQGIDWADRITMVFPLGRV